MKKFLLILTFLFAFTLKSNASWQPEYLTSVNHWGIGVAAANEKVKIYQNTSIKSKILEEISWDSRGDLSCKINKHCRAEEMFLTFSPNENGVFFSTDDENEEWIKICYNQKRNLFGWIKKSEETKYYTWAEFIDLYGKKYGFYLFRDVPKEERRLYSQPTFESNSVDSFIIAKKITPWLVRGNWILVKVDNFDGKIKTGWLHFRLDNGRLLGFCRVKD